MSIDEPCVENKGSKMMKHKGIRITICILAAFIALTAIGGGIAMLVGAEADRFPLEWLQGTPFSDYTIPALILAVMVGGSLLIAAVMIFKGGKVGVFVSMAAGLIMMGYITVEVLILKQVPPGPTVIESMYFGLGLAILGFVSNGLVFSKLAQCFYLPQFSRTFVLFCVVISFIVLTACTMASTPTTTPTLGVVMTSMVARMDGILVEIDGCIRVIPSGQDDGYALVWPPDHNMTIEDGHIRVMSGLVSGKRRETILEIGEKVTLSGGIVVSLDEQLKQTIPANCPGPYWAVGDQIRPLATQTPE